MEGRSHSLRLPLPTPRRPMYQRTASSSSEASHASNSSHRSHGSEDQFVLSPSHTPAHENAPPRVIIGRFATDSGVARNGLLLGKEVHASPRDSRNNPRSPNYPRIPPTSKSRPVVIEPPASRSREDSTSAASASIPPVPLSARGDVPGGYFPLHEDPDSRVHIPHPFHLDADMARQSSLQRAAESSKSGADPRSLSPTHHAHVSSNSNSLAAPSASATPDTPISSYMPSGLHDDVVLPMGKYYPSNWEKRHGKSPQQQQQQQNRPPATTHPAAALPIKSEPQVPKFQGNDHANRPGSDIKRRLQQYQRDMVAQAAMAANALLAANNSSSNGGKAGPGSAAKSSATVPHLLPNKGQLAATFLRTHKPLSPRLQPVGSPGGPVTPMSLEADSYLSLRSPVRDMVIELPGILDSAGDGRRVVVAGKGKHRRRESRSMSSPVEMGAASV